MGRKVTESVLNRISKRQNVPLLQGQPDTAKQLEKEAKLSMWFWIIDVKT